jgi:hypothetical protein
MAQARCPRCLHAIEVPDCLAFGLIRCPECQEAYSYQPGPLPVPEVAPTTGGAPQTSAELLASILAEPARTPSPEPTPEPPVRTPTPAR